MFENTPLMQINPYQHDDNAEALREVLARYQKPWEETVTLGSVTDVLASSFGFTEDDPIFKIIQSCPKTDITAANLYLNGREDVVICRIIEIDQEAGQKLRSEIENNDREKEHVFMREFTSFGEDGAYAVFVVDGHIYVSPQVKHEIAALYSGNKFFLIKRKEHEKYVETNSVEFDGVTYILGGFKVKTIHQRLIDLLNTMKAMEDKTDEEEPEEEYRGRMNTDWIRGQPLIALSSTYQFFWEGINETSGMLEDLE